MRAGRRAPIVRDATLDGAPSALGSPARVSETPGFAGAIPVLVVRGLGPRIEAGITTRRRNFRWRDRHVDPDVRGAYAELEAFARGFRGWVRVEQVHGTRVRRLSPGLQAGRSGEVDLGEADGLAFAESSVEGGGGPLLTVTVADCVPVFLAWDSGYALLHAGWRGVAAGILEAGIQATGSDARDLRIHLGPAIGPCCYEVGPEVAAALFPRAPDLERALAAGTLQASAGDRLRVDLRGALTARALALGADPRRVSASPSCTACDGRFHSFRGSGERTARRVMLAFVGARAAG